MSLHTERHPHKRRSARVYVIIRDETISAMSQCKKNFIEMAAPEYWYTYAIELADTADQIYHASKRKSVAYYALGSGCIDFHSAA